MVRARGPSLVAPTGQSSGSRILSAARLTAPHLEGWSRGFAPPPLDGFALFKSTNSHDQYRQL